MTRTDLIILLFLSMSLGFQSCNEDDANEDFPDRIGIKGRVLTQNQFQQPLYSERNDIEVLLEVGFRSFPLEADNVGQFQLGGAPVGTYTITLSKEGYGTRVIRGIRISTVNPEYPVVDGFQVLPTFEITQIPNTVFENIMLDLDFEVANEDTIWTLTAQATMNPGPPPTGQAKGYRLFLGTDEMLSKEEYLFEEHYTTTTAEITRVFEDNFFDSLNIRSGDVIYALFYGDANFDLEEITQEGDTIFPNLSQEPSPLTSVALP